MSGDWRGPVAFQADANNYLARSEDQKGLGLETGNEGVDPFRFVDTNPFQYGQLPQQINAPNQDFANGYKPSLNLDTSGPSFQYPQYQFSSAQSNAPPTSLVPPGTSSSNGGEILSTPDGSLYGLPNQQYMNSNPTSALDQRGPNDHTHADEWLQSFFASNPAFQPNFSVPQPQQQPHMNTISPHQFAPDFKNPPKLFNNLLRESRASTSSASSNDGHDWSNNGLENWKTVESALGRSNLGPGQFGGQRGTVPAPSTSSQTPTPPSWQTPNYQSNNLSPSDVQSTVSSYLRSPNRLEFGERKILVMSPKVGQKSYGSEKRFLCPHPQATLYGGGWMVKTPDGCPKTTFLPPRINISLSGEVPSKDSMVSWTTLDGENLDERINTSALTAEDKPFVGNVSGKNLHITDSDGKRRDVKALVTIKGPMKHYAGPNGWGHTKNTVKDINSDEVLGVFESKEIKIISKPSKKKASAKSGELLIQHGTTIALFNRVKSQTTSTRYLSMRPDMTTILGSDGKPMTNATAPPMQMNGSPWQNFTASANVWESWIIWLADPNRPAGPGYNLPIHPGWPSAPANAINGSAAMAIRYNSLVVLQSLQTGQCSPVLVVRRIEQDTDVVGADGTTPEMNAFFPEGEAGGDLVAQLQKVAFEVYRPDSMVQLSRDSRHGGHWLSCDQDTIQERSVRGERKWTPVASSSSQRANGTSRPSSVPSTPSQRFGLLPMTPHTTNLNLPSTPSSPVSTSSGSIDYFGSHSRKPSSASLMSPPNGGSSGEIPLPTDGGPVRRHRTGSASSKGPLARPAHRKRQSADSSPVITSQGWEFPNLNGMHGMNGVNGLGYPTPHMSPRTNSSNSASSAALSMSKSHSPETTKMSWTLDIGETCVWTIVSTEQKEYTFYVPQNLPTNSVEPFAPYPEVSRILPPGAAKDNTLPGHHVVFTSCYQGPMITLYGSNFKKGPEGGAKYHVYYGDQPAEHDEVRCDQVMAAAEPQLAVPQMSPVTLVREDGGVIVPTSLYYSSQGHAQR